ncbi:hypothetical protein [uncultured Microbacterium sp.]|uniref:hypothetical protein n=1 Tax=uncultured Microbacterium sp. TaxID=191216 RepID=UPI0025F05D5D|nr:hypothetical protein [uncultured Microbacterium sp.]
MAGLVLAVALGGCAVAGPTGQERADELAKQLETGEFGVRSADAVYLSSFSGDLSVSVVMEADAVQPGYAVPAETLAPILGTVARSAEEMGVPAVVFYAEEEGGIDVSMVAAARELGISEAVDGNSLHLTGKRLETVADQ